MYKIRLIRKAQKISGWELAKMTGISLQSVYRYEKGERTPKIDDLVKIAKALRVDVTDLIDVRGR